MINDRLFIDLFYIIGYFFFTIFLMPTNRSKRLLIKGILATCLLSISRVGFAATQIIAVRLWPSETYTRITLESNQALNYSSMMLSNPDRLVVDIDTMSLNPIFQNIAKQAQSNDPFIKNIRVAQNTPTKVRLVIELKQKTKPSIFTLKPIAEFNHRFVIDLYPEADPLMAFIENLDNSKKLTQTTQSSTNNTKKIQPYQLPTKKNNTFIVMLDPGHGGEDPGAVGYYKTKEKVIVLQIAKRLRDLLKKEKNIQVFMTRDEDIFLPLNTRVQKARFVKADLFMSIHADGFTKRTAQGSSVYALSTQGASSTEAKFLAQTQNEADLIGGINLKNYDNDVNKVLLNLTTTNKQINSQLLAQKILAQMAKINKLHSNNVETAGFAVLKSPEIPSILVETAFISNLAEEKKLKTAAFQNKIARALLFGIKQYIQLRKV